MAAILFTLLARASDGLELAVEENNDGGGGVSKELREKAKSVACSLADHADGTRLDVDVGDMRHYVSCVRQYGVAFVVVVGRGYPREATHAFLEEVSGEFFGFIASSTPELAEPAAPETHGGHMRHRGVGGGGGGESGSSVVSIPAFVSYLSSLTVPYKWVGFDRMIERRRRALADPTSASASARVRAHLEDIHGYMSENIDALLERGETMGDLRAKSERLSEDAKKLKMGAKRLNACASLRAYALPGGVAALLIGGLILRFYVFV